MQNEKFSTWANNIGLTQNPRLVGVMYTLLGKYNDADKLLDQGGSVEKVLGVLKAKGVPGVEQAEAILQGGGAAAPKPQVKDEGGEEGKGRASRLSEMRENARKNQAQNGPQDDAKQTPFDDKTAAEKGQPVQSDKPMTRLDKRRAERAGKGKGKGGMFGRGKAAGGKSSSMVLILAIVAVLLVVGGGVFFMMNGGGGGGSEFGSPSPDFGDFGSGGTAPSVLAPDMGSQTVEAAPRPPDSNPLNFKGSLSSRGFLGKAQALILVLGIGVLASLIGDVVYREQKLDGVVSVLMAIAAIAILLPNVGIAWVGLILFLIELAFVVAVSMATGKDFSPLAAHFLLVAVFGGLIFTRIGAVQSIFPAMLVSEVPPIAQLGYLFSTMNFSAMAFPFIVYLYFLLGIVIAVVESVRPSGEDKSSKWGSLASGGFGLLMYFVFLLGVHTAPWISYLIAFTLSVAVSAALRSQAAKQWVSPEWSVRSPFDGAMLFTAILLGIVVIFGQQWWLIAAL